MNRDVFFWIAIAGLVVIICILLVVQKKKKTNNIDTPLFDIGELFDKYYTSMLEIVRPIALEFSSGAYYDYDLLACLYSITMFYISLLPEKKQPAMRKSLNSIVDERFRLYLNDRLKRRLSFYGSLFQEIPIRGEWCLFEVPSQPDIRLIIAFGDILYNPACLDDYQNAPVQIRSVFEKTSFFEKFGKLFSILQEYTKCFAKGGG